MSVRISPLFVIAVATVVVTASVGVYFLMSDNERYDITIAWADKDCYEPFWIADKMGFWNDEGVKVKGVRVANGSEVASAILSGTADCGGMGADPLLRMLRDDDNASIICRYQAGSSYSEFVARDGANGGKISRSVYQSFFDDDGKPIDGKKADIGGIEMGLKEYLKYALTGADVGMHMGTAYWSWFLGFLENIDLSPQDLGYINDIAFGIQLNALDRGDVDLISGGSPNTETALGMGDDFFIIHDPDPKMTTILLMASGKAQSEKGDALTKVLKGLQRACDHIYNNPDDASQIIKDVYGRTWSIDDQKAALDKSLWGIDIVDADVNPNADVGAIVKAAELINAAGRETKGDLPVGDNIRNRINYEFMREAGLPAAEFVLKEKDERWGIIPP